MDRTESAFVRFDRRFFSSGEPFMRIGDGSVGGKASGLVLAHNAISTRPIDGQDPSFVIDVPVTVVIATDVFEAFMSRNRLSDVTDSGASDVEIAMAFTSADFPAEHAGDLVSLASQTRGRPLAVRSSSILEDSLAHPFAGVYETKMVPNNNPSESARIRSLLDAVKFVYASTFFTAAVEYARAIGAESRDERMAVVIQEVVGSAHASRFYPELSGVGRSYNYYRIGSAKPEDGVVHLALGLGKTVVDGGTSWAYSPAYPRVPMPFGSIREMMYSTQLDFWAVNIGKPPRYDPSAEAEFLIEATLEEAEQDSTLGLVASTFDGERGVLVPGVGRSGARVLDFGPLLKQERWPLNPVLRSLLGRFEIETGGPVEVEFAATFDVSAGLARLAVLQVRPMMAIRDTDDVGVAERGSKVLVSSDHVMGNGSVKGIRDIVFIKPGAFDGTISPAIAKEVALFNRRLRDEGKRYLLIGFGRWGTSDPAGGIPVSWGQIGAAAVIVEVTLPGMRADPSQGSHFFHNLEAFQICYFSLFEPSTQAIDWAWLDAQTPMGETDHVRHVISERPLLISIDGRQGRGEIWAQSNVAPANDE